jgi:DNA-directed RNA polymerase subunit F
MTEEYLTLAEIKELLKQEQSKRILTLEQNYALEHATKFAKLEAKESRKLVKELVKIEPVTEAIACKIADMLPQHPAEVDAIFLKERTTLEDEAGAKILEVVKKYL